MKYFVITVAVLSFIVMVMAPLSGFAADFAAEKKGPYIEVKPGAYFSTGNLHDNGFDTVFTGEIAVGSYLNPNLAFEGEVGYFKTNASNAGVDKDIWVVPVTASLKIVLPFRGGEAYAGGGVGVYFATMETTVSGSSTDDSGAAFGGHGLLGFSVNISRRMFIGTEGRYIFTTKASLLDTKTNLDGFMLTGIIGFRL
ncbi:MAG TPA: outer membrane beta-barrel protein [Candidatus Sulfobium mesophilum]|nr:outer membrane beta-barrel protein [Candidatus Sulfobium mesophilum]